MRSTVINWGPVINLTWGGIDLCLIGFLLSLSPGVVVICV